MGRPLRKQNFGNIEDADFQLQVRADIGNSEEDCWIVDQPGSRTYTVSSVAGGGTPDRTGRVRLQQGTITAEGQARQTVTPYDGVPNVQATATVTVDTGALDVVTITEGGTGYSVAPAVVVGGNGTGGAATAVITNGVVTAINITNGGSDYTNANLTLDAPAVGGAIEYTRTLLQHTVKTWEGNVYTWKLGETASVDGAATLPAA